MLIICTQFTLLYYNVSVQLLFFVLQFFVILLLLVLTEVTLVLVIHIYQDKVSSPPTRLMVKGSWVFNVTCSSAMYTRSVTLHKNHGLEVTVVLIFVSVREK